MNHNDQPPSFGRRFRRNHLALAAFGYLCLAVLLAVFGYGVAPDRTPDANLQMPGLSQASAGTCSEMLALKPSGPVEQPAWLRSLFFGAPLPYTPVLIRQHSFEVKGDSVYAVGISPEGAYPVVFHRNLVRDTGNPVVSRCLPLGADAFGRCIFSRLLLGYRVSLSAGALAVGVALTIGLVLGALGGYFGGRTDALVMLLINTFWSIPTLLMVFAFVMALGRSAGAVFLALGLTLWVDVARLVRGQVMALRARTFVEAAHNLGLPAWRIAWRHLLPNLLGPLTVVLAGAFSTAILLESGLSFLGFGMQPPAPSWGSMLSENYGLALSGRWVAAMAPAAVIALTIWAFNVVGNGVRDAVGKR